jgi:GT2 family glycosyltransferase
MGMRGKASQSPFAGFYQCDLEPNECCVSVIIPTRGGVARIGGTDRVMVVDAVRSIVKHAYTVEYEIVIVHDEDADPGYLDDLGRLLGDRFRVVRFTEPFNFSAKVNMGVRESRGDVVVLLNDEVEVLSERWLDQLVAIAQQPDVGAVGAKLLFEDGTIQHAGHAFTGGQILHVGAGEPDGPGEFGMNLVDREVSGVTAACLAQRREVWTRLGGLDEALPNNFNDVDYCQRIRAKGYRIVQANSVILHHFESRTRQPRVHWWETSRIMDRLGTHLSEVDPFTPDRPGLLKPNLDANLEPVRDFREWVRVTREVVRAEGMGAAALKASRRVTGRRTRPAGEAGLADVR